MEEFKNIKEIIELCKEELENNDENTHATLDLVDLKELENLINKYKEQQIIIGLMAKDIAENKLDEDICSKVRNPEKEECDCYADMYDACYGCVIEYYEKKARDEND